MVLTLLFLAAFAVFLAALLAQQSKSVAKLATFFGLSSASAMALATPPTTLAELTAAVDFATVSTAMLTIAGVMIAVYITWRGVKFVLRAVKGL